MVWRPTKLNGTSEPSAYELWSLTTPPIADKATDGGINWDVSMMRIGSGLLDGFDWAEGVIEWINRHTRILGEGLMPIPGVATRTAYYKDLLGNELGDIIRSNTTVSDFNGPTSWGDGGVELETAKEYRAVTKVELQKEAIKVSIVLTILFIVRQFGLVVPATALATSAKAGANVFYRSAILSSLGNVEDAIRSTHEPELPHINQRLDDIEATLEHDAAAREAIMLLMRGLDDDADAPLKEGIAILEAALNSTNA